jgi:hypothetical protein
MRSSNRTEGNDLRRRQFNSTRIARSRQARQQPHQFTLPVDVCLPHQTGKMRANGIDAAAAPFGDFRNSSPPEGPSRARLQPRSGQTTRPDGPAARRLFRGPTCKPERRASGRSGQFDPSELVQHEPVAGAIDAGGEAVGSGPIGIINDERGGPHGEGGPHVLESTFPMVRYHHGFVDRVDHARE